MIIVNATLINLYHLCKREMWLHANGIRMEHTSDAVYDGKMLHENSYPQRAAKYTEIELSAIYQDVFQLSGKIDFYDASQKIVHEIKRSDTVETAHKWQVKFYIWLLELNGILDGHGLLEYPKIRQTDEVWLDSADRDYLQKTILKIQELLQSDDCPKRINSKICRSCSYYELCYVDEI